MRFSCDVWIESGKDRFLEWDLIIQAPSIAKVAEIVEARAALLFGEARIFEMNIHVNGADEGSVDGICFESVPKEIIQHKSVVDRLRCWLDGK